jgi:putative salt-induced outer membrane protein
MNRIRQSYRVWLIGAWMVAGAGALEAQAPAPWKTSGSLDFGFVSATGNTDVTTISFGEKVSGTKGGWTLSQMVAQVYGKTNGVESANQLRGSVKAVRELTKFFGGFAGVQYERNAFAGFNRRFEELLGVQWKPVSDSSNVLTFDGGAVLTQQENKDATTKNSTSARGAMAFRHNFRPTTYFSQAIEYLPVIEAGGAYRLNTETALVAPLSARIGMKVSYVFQFNSAPPTGFGTTDRVFTSGLQVSF